MENSENQIDGSQSNTSILRNLNQPENETVTIRINAKKISESSDDCDNLFTESVTSDELEFPIDDDNEEDDEVFTTSYLHGRGCSLSLDRNSYRRTVSIFFSYSIASLSTICSQMFVANIL